MGAKIGKGLIRLHRCERPDIFGSCGGQIFAKTPVLPTCDFSCVGLQRKLSIGHKHQGFNATAPKVRSAGGQTEANRKAQWPQG